MAVRTEQQARPFWVVVIANPSESDYLAGLESLGLFLDAMPTKTGFMMRHQTAQERRVIP